MCDRKVLPLNVIRVPQSPSAGLCGCAPQLETAAIDSKASTRPLPTPGIALMRFSIAVGAFARLNVTESKSADGEQFAAVDGPHQLARPSIVVLDEPIDFPHARVVTRCARPQARCAATLITCPSGLRTKNRRMPHGSSVSGCTIS